MNESSWEADFEGRSETPYICEQIYDAIFKG